MHVNQRYKYLKAEDLQEAQEIAQLMSKLNKEEKMQVVIYISALVDRNMLVRESS